MEITREKAIKIVYDLSDQDNLWDILMDRYNLYDEWEDSNPSIYDLFEALNVSKEEVHRVNSIDD